MPPGGRICPELHVLTPKSEKSAAFVPEKVLTGLDMVMLRLALVLVMRNVSAALATP